MLVLNWAGMSLAHAGPLVNSANDNFALCRANISLSQFAYTNLHLVIPIAPGASSAHDYSIHIL